MNINVALVGAGYWGRKLLPKFRGAKDCSVAAVCDLDAGLRAECQKAFPDIPTTASYDDVLKDPKIDAVILVTPPATHFALGKKALEAGKHIWIEKPHQARFQRLVELRAARRVDPAVRFERTPGERNAAGLPLSPAGRRRPQHGDGRDVRRRIRVHLPQLAISREHGEAHRRRQ